MATQFYFYGIPPTKFKAILNCWRKVAIEEMFFLLLSKDRLEKLRLRTGLVGTSFVDTFHLNIERCL